MSDYTHSDEWQQFVRHVRQETVQKMDSSAFVMQLVPDRENLDIKFAVELGLSIMLDKPILAVAMPGVKPPQRLLKVADEIVYADIDTEEGQQELGRALDSMRRRFL